MTAKLVIALDTDFKKAKNIIKVAKSFGFDIFKVGHLLFDTQPKILDYINSQECKILLDLKFHDIPSVIAKAVKAILKNNKIFAFTLHSLAAESMMEEVKKTVLEFKQPPLIFAVTILTSLEEKDIKKLGFKTTLKNTIFNLAKLAKDAGMDGVVCSPKEVVNIKKQFGKEFLTLVPGVSISQKNVDQKRTDPLENVISYGADYIVVGRSIYEADNLFETFKLLKKFFI